MFQYTFFETVSIKEFQLKITVYVLTAALLISPMIALAEKLKDSPKKDIIEAQQAETEQTIELTLARPLLLLDALSNYAENLD